jgi:3-oxoacyl-[acyl-carrier protein] reductase
VKQRRVLVTGASGGIGAAISKALAAPHTTLYLHYYQNERSIDDVRLACEQLQAEVVTVKADLSHAAGVEELLTQCGSAIDVFVHSAGQSVEKLFLDTSTSDIMRTFQQHLFSFMELSRGFLPHMLRNRYGKIVAVSSVWGETGAAYEVVYSAAKSGMNGFVKALAKEMAPNGIQVNGVAPGAINTSMLSSYSEEEVLALTEEIPAGRLGTPMEVAETVAFLCSERATYIHGHVLSVNGGWYC